MLNWNFLLEFKVLHFTVYDLYDIHGDWCLDSQVTYNSLCVFSALFNKVLKMMKRHFNRTVSFLNSTLFSVDHEDLPKLF